MPEPTPVPPPPPAGDHVQSTATGELLEKLGKAPRLDEQRFVLEGEVGKGGMGAVLKIHDRHLNRRLAMKVLLERPAPRDDEERKLASQLLGRFLEEAQVTSQLDHPGVVPVHELGLDGNGKVWFTMRLVKGRTASEVFADAFAETNDWTVTRALEVVLKVCDTMAYAHDKGVLHRDLKPQNVMVGRFGEVYVMDWGLAKVLGQADRHDLRIAKDAGTGVSKIDSARKRDAEGDTGSSVVSMDGQQLGTPSYMPPEQARSEALDARADVYAIGAMLYELLTGRPPYVVPGSRKPAYRILDDVLEGPPKRIEEIQRGVPAELVAIVEKAMARDHVQRFANVTELASDLRAFLAQRTVKAYRTGALVEMRLWMRRNRLLASVVSTAAGMLLVATVLLANLWMRVSTENAKNGVFADVDRLARARRFERDLYPAVPEKVPAMEAWLRDLGKPLAARLPDVDAALALLRSRSAPTTPAQQQVIRESHPRLWELEQLRKKLGGVDLLERDDLVEKIKVLENEIATAAYDFADPIDADYHRTLTRLALDLKSFVDDRLIQRVESRIAAARTVLSRTTQGPAYAKWAEAIESVKSSDGERAARSYGHLTLFPIPGLVPIGMDGDSKLWEFVHIASGAPGRETPARDPKTGRLVPSEGMGIVFVLVPPGNLAATDDDPRRLTRLAGFFLSKYEMTRSQWQRLTGRDAFVFRPESPLGAIDDMLIPASNISWLEGTKALEEEGLVLPSELQWDYACRAGRASSWVDLSIDEHLVTINSSPLPVGSRTPNPFGLHDMAGNIGEWCFDAEGEHGTERDGDGRRSGRSRIRCVRSLFASGTETLQVLGSDAEASAHMGLRAARSTKP